VLRAVSMSTPSSKWGEADDNDAVVTDDEQDDEVLALAAKLAPALEEADALFSSIPAEFRPPRSRAGSDDGAGAGGNRSEDDDSIEHEVEALGLSEQLLRQELEMAQDFSALFRTKEAEREYLQQPDFSGKAEHQHHQAESDVRELDDPMWLLSMTSTESNDGIGPGGGSAAEADVNPTEMECREEQSLDKKAVEADGGSGEKPDRTGAASSQSNQLEPIPIPSPPGSCGVGTPSATNTTPDLDQLLFVSPSSPRQGGGAVGAASYTTADHSARVGLLVEDATWYSVDLSRHFVDGASTTATGTTSVGESNSPRDNSFFKEYCLTIPETKLKHLFLGLQDLHHSQQQQQQSASAPHGTPASAAAPAAAAAATTPASTTATAGSPPSRRPLTLPSPPHSGNSDMSSPSPSRRGGRRKAFMYLPVRTLSVRIRPDVLCGAVMDAVQCSLLGGDGGNASFGIEDGLGVSETPLAAVRIKKRQGGHLQAIVEPKLRKLPSSPSDAGAEQQQKPSAPFFLDAQLCTHKSDQCERVLLIRVYHYHGPPISRTTGVGSPSNAQAGFEDETGTVNTTLSANDEGDSSFMIISNLDGDRDNNALSACNHLREACALVQRMESPQTAKRIRVGSKSPDRRRLLQNRESVQQLVSQHLLTHYRACPSVLNGQLTLPSLNSQDWQVIKSCWPVVSGMYEELESRDLTYNSLKSTRFGAFPALPTLDVHYCSQIRQLSRQDMIVQLLKSASELEDYARRAEYACANMISLLQPTFETYEIDAPSLPKAKPLTAYPLDFVAPQSSCPPWGRLVMEALNEVQKSTSTANENMTLFGGEVAGSTTEHSVELESPFSLADQSVQRVLKAFQNQYDEEKGARLGRKNAQVMDRLAKMQQHEYLTIQALDQSHRHSEKAAKAAQEFQSKSGGTLQVPLLKWSIVVGGSTGTCWVTASDILFVTQLIPVFGGSKVSSWKLNDVEFTVVQEGAPSLLNPLPTVISVAQNGQEVYSFRPSMGGSRLKSFLDIVQRTNLDDPPSNNYFGEV